MDQCVAQGTMNELIVAALLGAKMLHDNAPLGIPAQGAGIIERMKYSKTNLTAQNGYAYATQALAKFAIKCSGLGILERLAGKPFDDGVAQNSSGCPLVIHGRHIIRKRSDFPQLSFGSRSDSSATRSRQRAVDHSPTLAISASAP